jgi:peptidoglycan/xylan/chitin deacetylase (PgdA/CDA1 family)
MLRAIGAMRPSRVIRAIRTISPMRVIRAMRNVRLPRIKPSALVFGAPALAVLLISARITLGRVDVSSRPQPKRFSGSVVVQRLPSLLASPRLGIRIPVVVVRDEAAATYYDSPLAFDSVITVWSDVLTTLGANVRVLPSSLAREDRSALVLVVPSSPCLTVATREAIDGAGARGVGVVLTGAAGTYDAGCRPLGYGLVIQATGASRASPLETREMTYVTLPSGSPLSADIPPGSRIELNPGKQIALRDQVRDGFYSDYALQPQPAQNEQLLDGALTHSNVNGRRIVYWGFALSDVVNRPWDRGIAQLLARNSVIWASGLPLATVEPWPQGTHAAASIAQDVESGFANARHAVDSLHAAGIRSTFFLTTDLAQHYERLSRRLAEAGEIGTHGDSHRLFGGLSSEEQRARLATTQRELRGIVGNTVAGLRPPEEQFDTATMSAWLAEKGTYLFGANDSRTAAPELLNIGGDTLVLVGRIGSDDFAVASKRSGDPGALTDIFLGEYERVRALGGYYVLSYHSQLLSKPELVPSLAGLARKLAADTGVWVAPVGEVAEWWRQRAQLTTWALVAGNRMRVGVRNVSDRLVRGAVVRVSLPNARRVTRADTRVLPSDSRSVRLFLPPLAPQSTRTFTVVFAGPK